MEEKRKEREYEKHVYMGSEWGGQLDWDWGWPERCTMNGWWGVGVEKVFATYPARNGAAVVDQHTMLHNDAIVGTNNTSTCASTESGFARLRLWGGPEARGITLSKIPKNSCNPSKIQSIALSLSRLA